MVRLTLGECVTSSDSLEWLKDHEGLQELAIVDCSNATSLMEDCGKSPTLRHVIVSHWQPFASEDSEAIVRACKEMKELEWLGLGGVAQQEFEAACAALPGVHVVRLSPSFTVSDVDRTLLEWQKETRTDGRDNIETEGR